MAKARGADGTPVDVPTRNKAASAPDPSTTPAPAGAGLRITPDIGEAPTDLADGSANADSPAQPPRAGSDGEAPTVPAGRARSEQARSRTRARADPPTVYGGVALRHQQPAGEPGSLRPDVPGGRRSPPPAIAGAESRARRQVAPADLPTAWLVIVEGPGKGASLQLGMGPHKIGRGADMRVRLDFGDSEVSRDTHAILTYDPRGNAFFVQQGNNLVYLRGEDEFEPVLTPVRLTAGSELVLGQTRLRFVCLCDESFAWQ